ncbi:MAG: D-aminoacyl-tRNA deacylase [Corynebacterium sp.]|nr:D-aminoacyl-tRNA deacylase [Corynebacterium sp.]
MRAVVTRCLEASVCVEGDVISSFSAPETGGLLALIGISRNDIASGEIDKSVENMARKLAELRILSGELSISTAQAPILVVSQFTLYGKTAKGRRPSWSEAAPAKEAKPVIDKLVALLRSQGLTVYEGVFGAKMEVSSINDGPFTVLVET